MLKVIFLGQKTIAKKCIDFLFKNDNFKNIKIECVVSDHTFYRDLCYSFNVQDLFFISNNDRSEDLIKDVINDLKIQCLISIQHPWILTNSILELVNNNAFNLHNAKLPNYRGHNSISHAILNDDISYTTTIHWMTSTVDIGDIAYEEIFPIFSNDSALSLYNRSVEFSVINFKKLVSDLDDNRTPPRKKMCSEGNFYSKNEIYSLKQIDNINNYNEVNKKSRAFFFPPNEPAYFLLNKCKFYVIPDFDAKI